MLLPNATLTVTRTASGSYVGGDFTPGTTSTLTLTANVQPIKGLELLNFPEGQRTRGILRVYTDVALQTADEATGQAADTFTYNGHTWQVQQVQDYSNSPIPHWRSFAFKVEPTAEHST